MNRIIWLFAVVGVAFGCALDAGANAGLPTLLYDDFDDGDYNGWTVENPYGPPGATLTPAVFASPEGYSIKGVGSGYGSPEAAYLVKPVSLADYTEICLEMRARSGVLAPTHSTVALFSGDDYYDLYDYGENEVAMTRSSVDGTISEQLHSLADPHEWHDFAWCRDADGLWSLSIDGTPAATDFVQETSLTSFDAAALTVTRQYSEIEWVRIGGVPEPATLALVAAGVAGIVVRRRHGA
jgi:hypothetical protein